MPQDAPAQDGPAQDRPAQDGSPRGWALPEPGGPGRLGWLLLAVVLSAGVLGTGVLAAAGISRDALRATVGACVTGHRLVGLAFPCLDVHPAGADGPGYAVVRGPLQDTEVLVVPTAPISGLEDPAARGPGTGAYWQAAWRARSLVEAAAGHAVPREEMGLAVNSAGARSQDQLHIHVDCVSRTLRRRLERGTTLPEGGWTRLPGFWGTRTWGLRVRGDSLGDLDPVGLMVAGVPGAAGQAGNLGLAVLGAKLADGTPGFDLVAVLPPPNDASISAENLLDHDCRVR